MTARSWSKTGRRTAAAFAVLVGVMMGSALAADQPVASGPLVTIAAFAFTPAMIEIAAGQAVTWVNHDETPHQVTTATRMFRGPGLDTGESWSFTFKEPGQYPYFCGLHPRMVGTVVVR